MRKTNHDSIRLCDDDRTEKTRQNYAAVLRQSSVGLDVVVVVVLVAVCVCND